MTDNSNGSTLSLTHDWLFLGVIGRVSLPLPMTMINCFDRCVNADVPRGEGWSIAVVSSSVRRSRVG